VSSWKIVDCSSNCSYSFIFKEGGDKWNLRTAAIRNVVHACHRAVYLSLCAQYLVLSICLKSITWNSQLCYVTLLAVIQTRVQRSSDYKHRKFLVGYVCLFICFSTITYVYLATSHQAGRKLQSGCQSWARIVAIGSGNSRPIVLSAMKRLVSDFLEINGLCGFR
jgi:hypothetical protein